MCDRVVIPVQPSGIDLWTLGLLDDRVGRARRSNAEKLSGECAGSYGYLRGPGLLLAVRERERPR